MTTDRKKGVESDYAVIPGETLLEHLEAKGMSQAELAARTGRPLKTINEIIKGKASITPDTALQLERVLGVSASFWNALERNYREKIAVQQERQRLKSSVGWLKKLPISELIRRGYLRRFQDEESQVAAALQFFGVSSTDTWERLWTAPDVAFRRSPTFVASPGAVASWLRVGEIKGQQIQCQPFNRTLFKSNLDIIRGMTTDDPEDIKKNLVNICKSSGVAVVFVAELPKTHLSGATQWLSPDKALIQLSCRHKSDDHFWFTFFHESGHILLHGKKDVFIEEQNGTGDAPEREADAFASQTLVPPAKMKAFLGQWAGDETTLVKFAKSLGIAAGIVVGQLQHRSVIAYHQFTHLRRFNFDLTN